jgi:hypothetical protein
MVYGLWFMVYGLWFIIIKFCIMKRFVDFRES